MSHTDFLRLSLEANEPAARASSAREVPCGTKDRKAWRCNERWKTTAVLLAVFSMLSTVRGFAPSCISSGLPHVAGKCRIAAASPRTRNQQSHSYCGLRGYKSFLRRGQGLNVNMLDEDNGRFNSVATDDDTAKSDNGFDPFFTLSEGILHAEVNALRSWPPPRPASLAEFEARLAERDVEVDWAFRPDPALLRDALTAEREEWFMSWKDAKPQETVALQGLKRDRWVPLDIPMSTSGIAEMLRNPYVQLVLSDPEQRNYWIYATGRTIFFFGSSVLSALMQINVEPDWRPWVYGTNYRTEVATALKRIAMSGEKKGSGEFEIKNKIPTIERVFRLFGSVFELYRRDCSNIAFGIYICI